MNIDPHKILGIKPGASADEIKAAYREAAKKHHPDAGGDAWAFQQVQQAFEVLSQPSRASSASREASSASREASSAGREASGAGTRRRPQENEAHSSKGPTSNASHRQTKKEKTHPSTTARHKDGAESSKPSGILPQLFRAELPLQNETTYFILVNVLDIVMTNLLLRQQAIEANPLAAAVFHRWGFNGMIAFKMFLVAFICVLGQIIATRSLRHARFMLIAGIVIVSAVVIYSAVLYLRTIG